MQYIIMFTMVVIATIVDIVTCILKAHITDTYESTIMKKGLYSKCINWFVMGFAIAVEFGLELLGQYYQCDELSKFTGAIAAGTVFFILMMMETISVFENFAIANPDSPLSKIVGKRLKKIQDQIVKKEEPHDENSQN